MTVKGDGFPLALRATSGLSGATLPTVQALDRGKNTQPLLRQRMKLLVNRDIQDESRLSDSLMEEAV